MVEFNSLVIETHGLTKTYKETRALQSLNLKVHKNSIFGFLGPNGAGKTTTIRLLLGLAKPSAGSGSVFGKDIVRDSVEIRRRIGYLAQEPPRKRRWLFGLNSIQRTLGWIFRTASITSTCGGGDPEKVGPATIMQWAGMGR